MKNKKTTISAIVTAVGAFLVEHTEKPVLKLVGEGLKYIGLLLMGHFSQDKS